MKLIFFDIDGTLIPDNSPLIPESAKEAIIKARENGHICMINTGRTQCMLSREFLEQVEFDGYLMGCGTMAVYHEKVLFHKTFPYEQSLAIMEGLRRHKVDAVLEGSEDDYCDLPENMHTDSFRDYIRNFRSFHFDSYGKAPGKYDKMFAYTNKQECICRFCEEFGEQLDVIDREHGFYEIVPSGCSKQTAMEHMAGLLQIPMQDTVAIGDSNNDYSMLKGAGIGIAMGNSAAISLRSRIMLPRRWKRTVSGMR